MQFSTTSCSEKSSPFRVNLSETILPSNSSRAVKTSRTVSSTTPDSSIEPYTALLAACYRTKEDDLAIPNTSVDYLSRELSVERLNHVHQWLWVVGRPMPPRALHHQKLLGREVVLTERMDMHLVWTDSRIFLKPLPRFLLEPQFWFDHLSCRAGCECSTSSPKHPESSSICDRIRLRRCALGYLISLTALLSYESDFHLAQESHVLPSHITWLAWKDLVREVLDDEFIHRHINQRYIYGELRLNRLNTVYRLTGHSIRGYHPEYSSYADFLRDNFTWLASVLAYMVIVLTAMQVGLGTSALQESNAFQAASYGFVVFAIVSSLATVTSTFVLFFLLFVYNWVRSVQYQKKRFGRSDVLANNLSA